MRTLFTYFYAGFFLTLFLPIRFIASLYIRAKKYKSAEKVLYPFVSYFMKTLLSILGIKVDLYGLENMPGEPALYVSNHQGNFDIIVITACIKKRLGFLVKKELKSIPVLRGWIKVMGSVYIDRKSVRNSILSIEEAIENIKKGNSMIVFPEGTRSRGEQLGEFKQGSFKLAEKTKVPIVPISVNGTYRIMEANHGSVKPARVSIVIGKPISTATFSKEDFNKLPEMVRSEIDRIMVRNI